MSTREIRAAALVRVSTDHQDLDSQRNQISEWAERQGMEVVWYEEPAVSGAARRRPVLDGLLKDARRGRFKVLVVAALDRIGRDVVRIVMTLDELDAAGVELVTIREGLDFRGPMGRAMASLLGAVAEIERAAIRDRVRAGMEAARKKGKRIGRPKLIFRPEEIEELRDLIHQGKSIRQIARDGQFKVFDTNGAAVAPSASTIRSAVSEYDLRAAQQGAAGSGEKDPEPVGSPEDDPERRERGVSSAEVPGEEIR